jgi:hypothetical protein
MDSFCLLFRSSFFATGRLWRRRWLGRFHVRADDYAFHTSFDGALAVTCTCTYADSGPRQRQ